MWLCGLEGLGNSFLFAKCLSPGGRGLRCCIRSEWTNLGDVTQFQKEEKAPYTHTAGESACLALGNLTTSNVQQSCTVDTNRKKSQLDSSESKWYQAVF